MNPLLLPPRLVFRALDDLHAIAQAARSLPDIEERLSVRIAALESRAGEILVQADRIDARLGEAVAAVEGIDEAVAAARSLEVTAQVVGVRGAEVAEALPTLGHVLRSIDTANELAQTLLQLVGPLQGTVDRLGSIVDRLPAPRRRREAG